MKNELYKMMITNARNYLNNVTEHDKAKGITIDAFAIAKVLSITLCISTEEILVDILDLNLTEV